jgi:hypothetical protein
LPTPTIFFARILTRNLFARTAAKPPVEAVPATIIAKAAKHAGHIEVSFRYSALLTEALKGASFTTPGFTNCFKAFGVRRSCLS